MNHSLYMYNQMTKKNITRLSTSLFAGTNNHDDDNMI